MTRIDFYILPVAEPHGALSFACRLAEKAWQAGNGVYIHGADEEQARALDAMLWQFRDSAFVPHELALGGVEIAVDVPEGGEVEDHRAHLLVGGGAVLAQFQHGGRGYHRTRRAR